MGRPVLIQDEEEFLSSAQRKHGDEAPASPRDDVVDGPRESALPVFSLLVNVCSVSGLNNEHVWTQGRKFRGHQVPILFPGKVTRVQDPNSYRDRIIKKISER